MWIIRQLGRLKGKWVLFFLIVAKVKEKHFQARSFKSNTIFYFSFSVEMLVLVECCVLFLIYWHHFRVVFLMVWVIESILQRKSGQMKKQRSVVQTTEPDLKAEVLCRRRKCIVPIGEAFLRKGWSTGLCGKRRILAKNQKRKMEKRN